MEITAEGIAELQKGTLTGELGVEPLEVTDELARGRLVVESRHLHPFGFMHGGAWVTLADSVAAWATLRHLADGAGFSTVELKTNVFAGAKVGDELVATARPLHIGRRTQVWEVRITREDRLMAVFTCTQMMLAG
ncbi:MAG TPA: PaaI family thioesterase [Thermoleophilaceae bacterium]